MFFIDCSVALTALMPAIYYICYDQGCTGQLLILSGQFYFERNNFKKL